MAGRGGRRRTAAGFFGGLLGLFALVALVSTALHADTTANQQLTRSATATAQHSDDYYSCLEAQSRSLVHPHDVVYVGDASLSRWVTITQAIGGWAHATLKRDQSTVALGLEHIAGRGSCDGDVLVSVRVLHGGRVVMARGRQSTP
jgi:hypothetical protein